MLQINFLGFYLKDEDTETADSLNDIQVSRRRVTRNMVRHIIILYNKRGIDYYEGALMAIVQLDELDFGQMSKVISWIESITEATPVDQRPTAYAEDIITAFEANGYLLDFTPPNKNIDDPDEYGRWIISQALKDLNEYDGPPIRGVISKFTKRWSERFGTAVAPNTTQE